MLDSPGFCTWRVCFDIMHTLDLGIYQHAVPCALSELVRGRVWAGRTVDARCKAASAEYLQWCRRMGIVARARQITPAWVKGPCPRISQVHCKAVALRKMAQWVLEVCARVASANRHAALRAAFFRSMVQADCVMGSAGRYLSPASAAEVAAHVEKALMAYKALATEAASAGLQRWRFFPKFHALTHIAFDMGGG